MYTPSIAMYPSKCVCIHASVPQWFKHRDLQIFGPQRNRYQIVDHGRKTRVQVDENLHFKL